MATTVDARGLSCPQPVILTLNEIQSGKDNDIIVLVDTDTSKENVIRAAESQGCRINEISSEGGAYRLSITRE